VFAEHLHTRIAFNDETQLEVAAAFLANGLMGLLTWLLDTEAPLSVDEMYSRFEQIAGHGIAPLLDAPRPFAGPAVPMKTWMGELECL